MSKLLISNCGQFIIAQLYWNTGTASWLIALFFFLGERDDLRMSRILRRDSLLIILCIFLCCTWGPSSILRYSICRMLLFRVPVLFLVFGSMVKNHFKNEKIGISGSGFRSSLKSNQLVRVAHTTYPPSFVGIHLQLFEISCYTSMSFLARSLNGEESL